MSAPEGLASPTSLKLVVSDLKKSETFYRNICLFRDASTLHFQLGGRPFSEVILRETEGNGSLTLMAFDDGEAPSPGAAVLTFSTDDLEAFARRAMEAGGKQIAEARGLRLGKWNALIAEFTDPDGNFLQVLQTIEVEA